MGDRLSRREFDDPLFEALMGEGGGEDLLGGIELDATDQHTYLTDNGAFQSIENTRPPITTDQDAELYQRAAADRLSGGDDLSAATMLRGMQDAAANAQAPAVGLAPPSWSRGLLGGNAVVPAVVDFNPTPLQELVYWPGDDQETRPITIVIGLLAPLPATGSYRPMAHIQWGTRDGKHTVDLDVGTGIELTLIASSCYVSVGQDGGFAVGQAAGQPIPMTASIGFLATAPRGTPIARTAYLDIMAPATPVVIPRPAFANSISALWRSNFTDAYTITLFSATETIGTIVVAASTQLAVPITLPNDCNSLSVTNNGGAPGNGRLIFGLSL